MIPSFGHSYAKLYDQIYQDKNYSVECEFLHQLLQRHGISQGAKLLDFGCGTGNHLLKFAQLQYQCTGVDLSQAMLDHAAEKAKTLGVHPKLTTTLPKNVSFDVITTLFCVMNYIGPVTVIKKLLGQFAGILAPNGIVVVETWNGAAVPFKSEKVRTKVVPGHPPIYRIANTDIDWIDQKLEIHVECKQNDAVLAQETHVMHYFQISEFRQLALTLGLEIVEMMPAFEHKTLKLDDFSILYVLRRRMT